jgi:selenocysteine lyase/cysteine desulfurase
MTLTEILTDETLRQAEFPVTREKIFLAHAGVCALPRRVAQAMSDCAVQGTLGDQEELVMRRITDARQAGAKLLSCTAEEVSLVGPTSLGLSLVAAGLEFRRGDNILIYHDDYPTNVYPWLALAAKGVEVRLLNTRGLGAIRTVDVMGQVDENTRLVALASCHFVSGQRIEHEVIVSDAGGVRGFSGRRFAQMAAGPLRRVLVLCESGFAGPAESADLRLAQRAQSGFRGAGDD